MSLPSRGLAAYQQASTTVSPARQIVMLYEGTIRFLREARAAIHANDIAERYRLVLRAYAVINALHCCLDYDQGADVATTLDRYYSYILHRLTMINVQNDPAICDEVIERLSEMRASWAKIADGTAAPATMAAPAGHLMLST